MNNFGEVLSVVFSLVMLVVVLVLTYLATRWMGKRFSVQGSAGMVKILDRVFVGQDKALMIIQVADKTMLVGMTAHNMTKLCDIENPDSLTIASTANSPDFSSLLRDTLKHGWGGFKDKKEDSSK